MKSSHVALVSLLSCVFACQSKKSSLAETSNDSQLSVPTLIPIPPMASNNRLKQVYVSGPNIVVASSQGLYNSRNSGLSWNTKAPIGFSTLSGEGDRIYAGGDKDFAVSSNGGLFFSIKSNGPLLSISKFVVDGGQVYTLAGGNVWVAEFPSDNQLGSIKDWPEASDFAVSGSDIYLAVETGSGVIASHDSGKTFAPAALPEVETPFANKIREIAAQGKNLAVITMDDKAYFSNDGGLSFTLLDVANTDTGECAIHVTIKDNRLLVATAFGEVYTATDLSKLNLKRIASLDSEELHYPEISHMTVSQNIVYLATSEGLFKLDLPADQ